ncbi:MAG TPA: hypothetical protein PK340_06165 [Bacilli bacterium]|nr:hypothetical protein [Bacilli bacterium]
MVTLKDFLCLIENTGTKVRIFEETDKPKDFMAYLSNLFKEPGDILKGSMSVFQVLSLSKEELLNRTVKSFVDTLDHIFITLEKNK